MNEPTIEVSVSQDYITKLSNEFTNSENCYKEYKKAAQKAGDEFLKAKGWEECLKNFLDKLNQTYGKANSLAAYLVKFTTHGEKICKAICHAKRATRFLLECMRCVSKSNEEIKQLLKELLEAIDCLNDPTLDKNISIMKCLEDFRLKIDEGITANLAAIKELLNLVRCVIELEFDICKVEYNEDTNEKVLPADQQGLLDDLKGLQDILNCNYPHASASMHGEDCMDSYEGFDPPSAESCPDCEQECGGSIPAEKHWPPCKDEDKCNDNQSKLRPQYCDDCGNDYKKDLVTKYNEASKNRCYTKCVWDHFINLEQKAKANMDATKAALDAAKAAKGKC